MSAEAIDPALVVADDSDLLENSVPRVLTFILGEEVYGVSISHVAEIIGAQRITPVPDPRPFMRGVINLRGTVIPVMDVRVRMNMEVREPDDRTCIVVVQSDELVVGLMVDMISDVIDVPADKVEAAPRRKDACVGDSIVIGLVQIDAEVKILIDLERLLHDGVSDPVGTENEKP